MATQQGVTSKDFQFVHELVQQWANVHPERQALGEETGPGLSYGELVARSARLSRRLRALGVGAGQRVAVWMDRSVEMIVALLATLEAGGAYVPIDPAYPLPRVRAMLDNVGAVVLISNLEVPTSLVEAGPKLVHPGTAADDTDLNDTDEPAPARPLALTDLAYVLYTSGSTGAPKGVAMSHRGLSRLIRWQLSDGPPGLTTLQFTPICFDVKFQEIFATLCTGGTLFIASDSLRRDPERLLATLNDRAIERLFLPYVALQQLAKAAQRMRLVPHALKHVITAGERLVITDAIAEFFRSIPGCRLDNHYGPTEAHLVTSFTLGPDPAAWPTLPPIGRPVGGVTVYNLDADLRPVGLGELGELYVAGDGLAEGYLGAPELTRERFLPDPKSGVLDARMYKTGDVVRSDPDGVLHFIGRADDQIKVRGYRVEPAEVARALTNHPRVKEAAVGLRTIAEDLDALVGYVVVDGAPVTAGELARHVRSLLPSYMVPSRFVFLDALPLTPTGKVDQRLLSQLALPSTEAEDQTGKSPIELVRAIWERVLGHDEIELDDDFFDVGGDSLLATWVVTELGQLVGQELELSILLQDSTIAGLARILKERAPAARPGQTSEIITLRPGPAQRPLYLVHPLGGEILVYRELARALKSKLRVLGLRWRPTERGPARTLQQVAAIHLAQVRAIQPSGPYLLAGWSFGGVLAYELAQQLLAAGERVAFLGLIDANPVRDPILGSLTRETPHFELLTGLLADLEHRQALGEAAGDLSQFMSEPSLRGLLGDAIPEGVTAAHLQKNLLITRDNVWAAMNYRACPYAGPIDLFQAAASAPALQESLAAELKQLSQGPLRLHLVAGDHNSILRAPLVEALASAMDSALQTA